MIGKTVVTERPETQEIVFERTFPVSSTTLWRCWTTHDVARWWGPRNWQALVHEMDVRPGGYWRYSLVPVKPAEGATANCLARYTTVDAPRTLEFLDADVDDEGSVVAGTESPTAIELMQVDGDTHQIITIIFPSATSLDKIVAAGLVEGMADALDRLDEFLHTG